MLPNVAALCKILRVLHTELLRLLNGHEAWAFVGSGPSMDAGLPSWADLVDLVAKHAGAAEVAQDGAFVSARASGNLPLAFEYLADALGRRVLVEAVENALPSSHRPGRMHELLAALPFAGYITTNYDLMLEASLRERGEPWISVGNKPDEARKLAGGNDKLVWHLHGAVEMPSDRSRLVLEQRDYDDVYRVGSEVLEHLKALLLQRRLIFVGFGFNDFDVSGLLRRIGGMLDPTRYAFGFVEKRADFSTDTGRRIFLTKHNIDVIPYRVRGNSHRQLTDMLEVYANLAVPRTLPGTPAPQAPRDLDPQTLGLLIYNELILTRGLEVPADLRDALLSSHILSVIPPGESIRSEAIQERVFELALALGRRVGGAAAVDDTKASVADAVATLQKEDLLLARDGGLALSDAGVALVGEKQGSAEVLEDRFRASLDARLRSSGHGSTKQVINAADAFFRRCIETRALGVAMAVSVGGPGQQDYHAVSLLQALPEFVASMADVEAARALVDTVQGVLRRPSDEEMIYLGTALQAAFAVHLLGYDTQTFEARHADLKDAVFVIDSSTLIPLLAPRSTGHESALRLIDRLKRLGCQLITTRQLVGEVSEHARWAQERVREDASHTHLALSAFSAATGRAGQRSNAFLEGFLTAVSMGECNDSLDGYLATCCGLTPDPRSGWIRDSTVVGALKQRSVVTVRPQALDGYTEALRVQRETYQADLQARRMSADTFTRDRQVAAEADVAVMVEALRDGVLRLTGSSNGVRSFFLSNTRIIDEVARAESPIVMRPEAALQWLLTLHQSTPEDLASLTSGLLWELQERGQNIVDSDTLAVAFRPFLDASAQRRDEELLRMQRLEDQRYAGAEVALRSVPTLDLPVVMESQLVQRVVDLEEELRGAKTAPTASALTTSEREELERLRKKVSGRKKVQRRDVRIGRRKRPPDD
jgi:hypothetical protein